MGERIALLALFVLLGATLAWWLLALWPTAGAAPQWLERARLVCFNAGPDGLPDASGWLLLVGQPIGMLAVLMVVGGREVRSALGTLSARRWGRALLAVCALFLAFGAAAATARVVAIAGSDAATLAVSAAPPDTHPRLDREAPALSLVDQAGERVGLDRLRGRPVLLTFAFGSCHSVCPAIVRETLSARDALREAAADAAIVPRVVVVTLDPWRDTPSRLPHLASHWELGEDDHVLSGSVEEVEAALGDWNVAYQRDPRTGDVAHPPFVYVLDADGRIAFASSGGSAALRALVERL